METGEENPGAVHADKAKHTPIRQEHETSDTGVQEIKRDEQVGEQTEDTNSISTLIMLSSSKTSLLEPRLG